MPQNDVNWSEERQLVLARVEDNRADLKELEVQQDRLRDDLTSLRMRVDSMIVRMTLVGTLAGTITGILIRLGQFLFDMATRH